MFENIIGQKATVETLRRELAAGRLPAAILLSGPRYSGKLSAALEIARVLTQPAGRRWSDPSCAGAFCSCNTRRAGYFGRTSRRRGLLRRVGRPAAACSSARCASSRRFDPPLWEAGEPPEAVTVLARWRKRSAPWRQATVNTQIWNGGWSRAGGCRRGTGLPPQTSPLFLPAAVSLLQLRRGPARGY
jgi:DNA polymerase III delta prime subunit